MRLVAAMFKHETNTFSPVPTPLERFNPSFANAARDAYRGTNTPLGGYIAQAEALGAQVSVPVAAEAWPSGPVDATAFETLANAILEAVDRGCEAVLLDLHGAMVGERHDDGEGELLRRIRELRPGIPIAVALDLHTNLTEQMVANSTAIVGYKTYPHVDMRETGEQAGRIVLDMLAGKCRPVMRWGNRPMIPHIMRQATDDEPMRSLIAEARRLETGKVLAATVFAGFPHADIHDAGLSAVAVADGDPAAAEATRDRLLDMAWERREAFVYRGEPLAQALARARAAAEKPGKGPVILLDHCDNCGSGGTQDDMTVIGAVLRSGLADVAAFSVADPQAVAELIAAGVGRRASVSLGGKRDMPSIGVRGKPLAVEGVVRAITDGEFTIRGPMYTGVRVGMGRTAVLDTGTMEIVVTERNHEPWDLGCLRSVGIEPTEKRFVLLKSRVHWRAGYKPIAKAVVDLAGQGVTTSDYAILAFKKLRRPIYPLDATPA
ncbi:MAG: M81 family metallopeptidase [Alphaproteobacteria bacterium]|nr:M81 family metallopeptidase [Alphaproteobacteria bacterium]